MNNVKRRFMILCSTIFALMLVLSMVSVYATQGNTWTSKATMATGRFYHQAVVVNEKIYVIGGHGTNGYTNSVEEYNPQTNMWTTKASMTYGRYQHKAVSVGGKIYAIGGYSGSSGFLSSVEEYDPATNKWTTKASMSTARYYHQAAVVDGKIYVMGGYNNSGYHNSVEEYDPATNKWTTKASMSTVRYNHQVATVGGKIYAIGGCNGSFTINSVEEYDPAKNVWTARTPMYTERSEFEAVVVDGKIYAIGGMGQKNYLNSVEEYNTTTNTWVIKAPMTTARSSFETVVVDGKIYSIGGGYYNDSLSSVEEYNPSINTWTTRASMNKGRYDFQAVLVNEKIYAIGGFNGNSLGNSLNSLEEYTSIASPAATELTVTAENSKVILSWMASEGATNYNIKRSTTAGGPYTTIATGAAITYTDTTAVNGTTYYYVVTAVNSAGESDNSNEVSATPVNSGVTLGVTSVDKAKIGDLITANVVIHNAKNICAEDFKLSFDTEKLEFVSAEGADGIKIYKEDSLAEGIRRYITASLGKTNAANGDKVLLKLTFKAIATGDAKIDVTKGRIADNDTLEIDLTDENCGEKLIQIDPSTSDVNRSGEFTLLDLAIDAWYYGDKAENTDTSKYDADVVKNGTIDDDDLSEIVKQILSNSNYLQ